MLKAVCDSRIELLSIVQYLSNSDIFDILSPYNSIYKDNIDKYFSNAEINTNLKIMKTLTEKGFAFDLPINIFLCSSMNPQMHLNIPLSKGIENRLIGNNITNDDINKLFECLNLFIEKYDFLQFIENNKTIYDKMISKVNDMLHYFGMDFIKELEDYLGLRKDNYNLILAPLYHKSCFAANIKQKTEANVGVSSVDIEDNLPSFIPFSKERNIYSVDGFIHKIWHETTHTFTNDLIDEHVEKHFDDSIKDRLLNIIKDYKEMKHYQLFETCLYEYIVRAICIRMASIHFGKERGDFCLNLETNQGFIGIEVITELFEKSYEPQKGKDFNIKSFFPNILETFRNHVEKNL